MFFVVIKYLANVVIKPSARAVLLFLSLKFLAVGQSNISTNPSNDCRDRSAGNGVGGQPRRPV